MSTMALTTQNNRSKNRNVNKGWVGFFFANKEFKHLRFFFFKHEKRLDSTFLYEIIPCRRRISITTSSTVRKRRRKSVTEMKEQSKARSSLMRSCGVLGGGGGGGVRWEGGKGGKDSTHDARSTSMSARHHKYAAERRS